MTANFLAYDEADEAAMNAALALLNNGSLKIYSGSQPAVNGAVAGTLLVTLTFGATAFGAATASGGSVSALANAIASGTAVATGTAGYFVLTKADGTTVEFSGTVGTSAANLIGPSTAITSGANVACSSFQITQLQNG